MKLAAEEMAGVNGGARRLAKISNIAMEISEIWRGRKWRRKYESCRRSMREIS
jgi:myosin heavy subunit